MATEDIEIRVKVDANGAISTLDSLGNEIKQLEGHAASGASTMQAFAAGIAGGAAVAVASFALEIARSINPIDAFFAAIGRSDLVDDVSSAFNDLTKAAGGTADAFLSKLNAAAKDSVTNLDLMKGANEALQAGLKPDAIVTLTAAAKQLADQTGGNTVAELDKLSGALEKGRVVAFRQVGVFVDSEKVIKEWGEQNKRAGESAADAAKRIDEQTKVQLLQNAVLDQLNNKFKTTGGGAQSLGDKVEQLSKHWEDLKNAASRFVERVPLIAQAFDVVNKALKNAVTALENWGTKTRFVVETVIIGMKIRLLEASRAMEEFGKALTLGFNPAADENIGRINDQISKLGQEALKLGKEFLEVNAQTEDLTKEINALSDGLKAAETPAKTTKDAIADITTKADAAQVSLAGLGSVGEVALQKLSATGGAVLSTFNNLDDEARSAGADFGNIFVSGFESILRGDLESGVSSIVGGLGKKIGADIGAELGTSLGGAFGEGFGGPIGGAIGSVIGQEFSKQLTAALKGDRGAIQDLLKEAFALPTGGLSMLIPDSIFDSVFGGDNAGTSFRKGVDKFFADAFDANRLSVIINGQLEQISDFDFGGTEFGDASKGFFDAFNGLDAAAQNAFSGLATAFNAALGQGEEFSSALAAVFANNLGGSLNNLQLMVQATGLSFDDMKNAAVEAFLDGKLSAQEAQRALAGIQQISEKGIPGALGAVTEAFHNLEEAGVKGGRVSTDAIRDIGAEAKELGIKTIPELMDYLVNVGGISADEVQKLMSTLAASGVDSIEEIVNATDESLIPILASLQDQNFPFKEAAEAASDFADSINNLPDSKEVDLIVNVKTKGDTDALKAYGVQLSSGSFSPSSNVGIGAA